MSATDELRRLLDERGVKYYDMQNHGIWFGISEDGKDHKYEAFEQTDGLIEIDVFDLTPEQAIAATLGAGECELTEFADVPFTVDYEIEGYDSSSARDYAALAECSKCGAYVIVPPAYHHVLTCDGDEVYQPYRYCPNCGRRVKGDAE